MTQISRQNEPSNEEGLRDNEAKVEHQEIPEETARTDESDTLNNEL